MKILNLLETWKADGLLPADGLCKSLDGTPYRETLNLFEPTMEEKEILWSESQASDYWGSGLSTFLDIVSLARIFSKQREIIMLLIAAIHDEL